MNFTQEIKRELLRHPPRKDCCRCAALSAAIGTCGARLPDGGFSFTSESEESAELFLRTVEQRFGISMTLTEAARDPKHGRDKLTFSCDSEEIARTVLSYSPENGLEDCCAQAYLSAAFLFGGSCTLPREGTKTGYHLEIVFDRGYPAEQFLALLDRFQIIGSIVPRGDKPVVYIKSREAISDLLSVLGAESALSTLEAVALEREDRNRENRVENCYQGNADRAATASAEQVIAFRSLKERGIPLDKSLSEALEARLSAPTLSLKELAETLGLTKSGLCHRFRKLMELYRKL